MTKRFMTSLPSKLLEAIDVLVEEGMYATRTEFIREASRYYLRYINSEQTNITED